MPFSLLRTRRKIPFFFGRSIHVYKVPSKCIRKFLLSDKAFDNFAWKKKGKKKLATTTNGGYDI
jgi:hypothetical protein